MAFAIAGAVSNKMDDVIIVPFDISSERMELFKTSFKKTEPAVSVEDLGSCDVLFLSVKPQMMKDAVAPLSGYDGLAVSIAAGLKIAFF